ncbi:MAG: hypothetical protein AAGA48_19395 [Myxococcota bacterium]
MKGHSEWSRPYTGVANDLPSRSLDEIANAASDLSAHFQGPTCQCGHLRQAVWG